MCPEENAVLPQPAVQQIDSFGGNSQLRSECIQRQEREGRANFPSLQVEIVLREVEKVLGRERERERGEREEATVCSGTQSPYPSQLLGEKKEDLIRSSPS